MNKKITLLLACVCQAGYVMAQHNDGELPAQLPPIPDVTAKKAVN